MVYDLMYSMMKIMKKLIYLACPYSHPDKTVMEDRFNRVNKVAAKLMATGNYIFSPISHTHPIACAGNLPRGWEYWNGYDTEIISNCGKVIVLMLEGWDKSTGVQAEIKLAEQFNIPVEYISELY